MILLAISCLLLLAPALPLAFALALVTAVADQMAHVDVADQVAVAAALVALALVAVVADQLAHVVADQVAVAALGQVAVAAAVVLHLKSLDHFVAVAVVAVVPQILLAEVVPSLGMQGTWPSSKTHALATIRMPWLHRMGLSLCPVLYSIGLHCTAT